MTSTPAKHAFPAPSQYNRLLLSLCKAALSAWRSANTAPHRAAAGRAFRLFLALITFLTMSLTVLHREDADGYQASHLFFVPRAQWEMDEGRGMLYEAEYYREIDSQVLLREVGGPFYDADRGRERTGRGLNREAAQVDSRLWHTTAYSDWLLHQQQAYSAWFAGKAGSYAQWLADEADTFDTWLAAQPLEYRLAHESELASRPLADVEEEASATGGSGNRVTQGGTVRRSPHAPAHGASGLPASIAAPPYGVAPSLVALPAGSPSSWNHWSDRPDTPPPRRRS